MTNAQRTWNVGETIEGSEYGRAPIGVFVSSYGGWICRRADGKWTDDQVVVHDPSSLFSARTIIARPKDAPAHIPYYAGSVTFHAPASVSRTVNVSFDAEEQILILNKIQAEANALIAERDALKQALRKAQDACQRLREERDAALKGVRMSGEDMQRHIAFMTRKPVFTPALGASPRTREDFAACPIGTQIQFREEKIRWEKKPNGLWAYDISSVLTNSDGEMASHFVDWEKRITLLPLARKPRPTLGDLLKEHAERRATSPVPEWKDHVRIPPAPPAVIHKGEKIDTHAQYDALPPGSRVRKAAGDWWTKMPNGDWWCAGEKMRDLAFPRTVLRIGYDDTAVSFDVAGVALKQDKPALRVGDMLRTVEDYERAPIGTKGNTSGLDFTWTRVDGGWALDGTSGGKPCPCDRMVCRPFTVTHVPARLHVGQVISTRDEYEALPVGASVWFNKDTRFPGDKVFAFWTKAHKDKWQSGSGSCADNRSLAGIGREIRSLP